MPRSEAWQGGLATHGTQAWQTRCSNRVEGVSQLGRPQSCRSRRGIAPRAEGSGKEGLSSLGPQRSEERAEPTMPGL